MNRVLVLLLFIVPWSATQVLDKKGLDRVWRSFGQRIPKWSNLSKSYGGDRSKAKASVCRDCVKVVSGFRVKDKSDDGRGNVMLPEGSNVVHLAYNAKIEPFVYYLLTTDTRTPRDTELAIKGEERIVEKNLIPHYKISMCYVTISKNEKASKVKMRILKGETVLPLTDGKWINGIFQRHKAFFVNYPWSQPDHQDKYSKKKVWSTSKRKKPDSNIYFIRLPAMPYSYVPGLGYVSQPARFSTSSLAALSTSSRPQVHPKPQSPVIRLLLEFVSNGKPSAVYRCSPSTPTEYHPHHQDYQLRSPAPGNSTLINLNRGPYIFNGKPLSIYLPRKN